MFMQFNDILPELKMRQSRRAFDPSKSIAAETLSALFDAARWAPSGNNLQPWRWLVGHKGEATFARLLALLAPGNQVWAQYASVLVLSAAEVTRLNPQGERVANRTALYDVGMANMSLATEATRRGLNLRMMGGFDLEGARKLLPEHTDAVCMIALGYANEGTHLPDDVRERDHAVRVRKPIAELMLS